LILVVRTETKERSRRDDRDRDSLQLFINPSTGVLSPSTSAFCLLPSAVCLWMGLTPFVLCCAVMIGMACLAPRAKAQCGRVAERTFAELRVRKNISIKIARPAMSVSNPWHRSATPAAAMTARCHNCSLPLRYPTTQAAMQ